MDTNDQDEMAKQRISGLDNLATLAKDILGPKDTNSNVRKNNLTCRQCQLSICQLYCKAGPVSGTDYCQRSSEG